MPLQPTRADYHYDSILTDFSTAYLQDVAKSYVHMAAFGQVNVQKQSGKYFTYPKEWWLRTEAAKRAPATESVGSGWKVMPSGTYFCDKWAIHHDVADEDYANYDLPDAAQQDATEFVTRQLWMRKEQLWLATYMAPSVWQGFSVSGSSVDFQPATHSAYGQWDGATANPLYDIDQLKKSMEAATGYLPNTLILAKNVWYALRNNPAIIDRIKYTAVNGAYIDEYSDMARYFGVERVLVAGGVSNTAVEGATANVNFMTTNTFLLCYAEQNPGLKKPSAGYTFAWTGLLGAGAFANRIKTIRMDMLEADRIEAETAFQFQVIGADLGILGTSVLLKP